jgi:hypothetical protein
MALLSNFRPKIDGSLHQHPEETETCPMGHGRSGSSFDNPILLFEHDRTTPNDLLLKGFF